MVNRSSKSNGERRYRVATLGLIMIVLSLFVVSWDGQCQPQAQFPNQAQQPTRFNNKGSVFAADSKAAKSKRKATMRDASRPVAKTDEEFDFQAPAIEVLKDTNEVKGRGGILISQRGVQVQADESTINMTTKQGVVSGNVVMTSPQGVFSADSARLNLESETGDFQNGEFMVEEEGFHIRADEVRKVSEFEFDLEDSDMTTCKCIDGSRPWEFRSGSCNITQEGYAHAYDTSFRFQGLPVLYTPYLGFPVKTKRTAGLLMPQWGITNRDGFRYRQPIFLPIDDSTDFTITPFVDTKSRVGTALATQKIFSTTSNLKGRMYYSNESMRGSSLRGLNVRNYADPTIDTNRFGGFYRHQWRPDPREELPLEFIADGHYTSDNLFIKEIEDPEIGQQQSQFLTSTAVLRGVAFQRLNAELRTEYNQMILSPQELQFQRVPELALSTRETFRPFGFNPYGLKLVTSLNSTTTDFVREEYYDGWRSDLVPRAAVPFHVSSYLRGQLSAELHQTYYSLRDTMVPPTPTPYGTPATSGTPSAGTTVMGTSNGGMDDGDTLESSNTRTLPIFNYGMGSGVEKVYRLERDSVLTTLAGLGVENQTKELVRLKHTIEPSVQYTFIPGISQGDLPLFDATDRYRQRSLFSYGGTSRIYGKFIRPYERSRHVEELSGSGETLPTFDLSSSLLGFDRGMVLSPSLNMDKQTSDVRELARFDIRQTYDYIEATKDVDPNQDEFSDINLSMILSPSSYFATGFQSNLDAGDGDFSSYDISAAMRDDREDALRLRYTYFEPTSANGNRTTSQITGNFEIKLHEQLRLGYLTRYDVDNRRALETRALVRFVNACKCWSIDLGVSERYNPDRTAVMVSFTFAGLGDITQNIGLPQNSGQ
jgi:LPS-assembly protein